MNMQPTRRLGELDAGLDIFSTPEYPGDLLARGIYPPPAISENTLIWGFAILRSARRRQIDHLYCHTFPAADKLTALKLALALENRAGKYSWEEKERVLTCLGEIPADIELSRLLEGREDPEVLAPYRRYADLSPALKQLVREGHLALKTALEIATLPEEIFTAFLASPLLRRLSFSEKRIFLTFFHEICQRDGLQGPAAPALLAELLSHPAPLEMVKQRRHPRLTALETRFTRFRETHLKGTGIDLQAPAYFEGSAFSLTFRFTPQNLGRKLSQLARLQEHINELDGLL